MSKGFDASLVKKAHAQLQKALKKEAFAPAAGIGAPPPQGGMPMDPAMAGGGAPMPPAGAMPPAGGAPMPMDPAMAGGAPMPMDPSMAGGAPPMPPGGEMPPVMVSLDDLMALFAQISQEMGGGGGGAPAAGGEDVSSALEDIGKRLEAIESALGLAGGAEVPPGAAGSMPPIPPVEMPPMGEAMPPMMDATAAPMPGMPVSASGGDGQVKVGKAEKIGDLVAKLRRK
jgi:hypothetical protein